MADCFFWGFYLREEYPGVIGKTTEHIYKSGKQLKWTCVGLEYFQPLFQDKAFQDPEARQAIIMVAKTHGISGHMNYREKQSRNELILSYELVWENNYERATRTARARILSAPYSEYGRLDVSLRMIARRLRLRRMEPRKLRPWYRAEYTKWHATRYAETQQRAKLVAIGNHSKSHRD
ncbi:hypothetical protein CSAL01_06411 [Colletotrichum salicis]|uniref:Uncharacterized protein n=1 Tax=Colletotrichum salicis TaxID=1209931 RepID=A0A135UH92_9PEZI|nr:hypothetical protein CSAL01_06411 [Colletotrichum salicis]